MTKLRHTIINVFVLLNVIGMVLVSTNTYAQSNTSNPQVPLPSQNNTVATIRTSEISGDITKIDGGKITVLDMGGKAYEYSINDSIKITRDTNIIKSNELRVGDKIKVIIDADKNTLIGVEAISGQIIDIAKYTIPVVILGIVVVVLIVYAINKSNKGKILTSKDATNS
jgi:hypothetical protein